jgi:hypothetical protein
MSYIVAPQLKQRRGFKMARNSVGLSIVVMPNTKKRLEDLAEVLGVRVSDLAESFLLEGLDRMARKNK